MADLTTQAQLVELLSISPAKLFGEPVLLLTIRPNPEVFESINLALSKTQAERLFDDLKNTLKTSNFLGNKKTKKRKN